MSSKHSLEVICNSCAQSFDIVGNTHQVKIEDGVTLHTMSCPHCQTSIPLWFETGPLIEARKELQKCETQYMFLKTGTAWETFQRAKLKFQTVYRTEQEYWKSHTWSITH